MTGQNSGNSNERTTTGGVWYRKVKDTWYAWKEGKQVSLRVRGKGNRKAAQEAFFRLMSEEPTRRTQGPKPEPKPEEPKAEPTKSLTIRQLVDAFLADAHDRITLEAFRGYGKFLTPFAQAHGDRSAESMTDHEAEAFSRKPEWSSTYRAGFLGTLVTAYRWAVKRKLLTSSPVEHVQKPPKASRGSKSLITEAEHNKLLAVADTVFGDFLRVLWNTGGRPGEITGLTAEQVKASADGVLPLDTHKESHKGKVRFLILTGEAWKVVRKRAEVVGSGLLFSGAHGRLTPKAVCSKMDRLCKKAAIRRVMAYGYRHTFATTALAKGVPDATVAALLGHADTSMLHKHYSHLTAQFRIAKVFHDCPLAGTPHTEPPGATAVEVCGCMVTAEGVPGS